MTEVELDTYARKLVNKLFSNSELKNERAIEIVLEVLKMVQKDGYVSGLERAIEINQKGIK